MSGRKPEREENALRIMRALSGVDEELLARSGGMDGASETKERKRGRNGKIVHFINRHGRALAACLCLAVLGAAYLAVEIQRGNGKDDGSGSGRAYIADNGMYKAEKQDTQNMACENLENVDGVPPEVTWDAENSTAGNHTNNMETADAEADQYHDALSQPAQVVVGEQEGEELSLEEAKECGTLGAYVPETIPAGCDFVKATYGETASGSRLVLTWSDGGRLFWIKLSQTLFAEPEEAAAGGDIAVYSAAGDWEETFWQPEKGGRLRFAVLYEDGVLEEYEGYLGKEDILKMFGKWPAEE